MNFSQEKRPARILDAPKTHNSPTENNLERSNLDDFDRSHSLKDNDIGFSPTFTNCHCPTL
jgi:hypothetical protein